MSGVSLGHNPSHRTVPGRPLLLCRSVGVKEIERLPESGKRYPGEPQETGQNPERKRKANK